MGHTVKKMNKESRPTDTKENDMITSIHSGAEGTYASMKTDNMVAIKPNEKSISDSIMLSDTSFSKLSIHILSREEESAHVHATSRIGLESPMSLG